MKKKLLCILTALSMLGCGIIPGMTAEAAEKASGTTYYVSTKSGRDSNNGTSQSTPFYSLQKINDLKLKPGDKILLECGSTFTNGYLHLKGQSGSKTAPIVIDKYGSGRNPVIDTNGQGIWFQNYGKNLDSNSHKKHGYVSSSILLYDSEYIEIKNLEIINKGLSIDNVYNSTDIMNRTGVAAVAQDKGTLEHIYLDNLNVHDVNGNVYDKHMNNGGIYFTVFKPNNEALTGIPRYDDVKIENCKVDTVNRWGIAVGYTAYWDHFTGVELSEDAAKKYGNGNVVIRNNYIKDAGGDAITVMYCYRPLVEYNVADGTARQINTTDYSATSAGRVAAGIWPWKCKDAMFQYNEAFDTVGAGSGNGDGQAWDADSGDGTIYQYNYSHNNSGGCVMFCYPESCNNIFRYNISQYDLAGVINPCGNPDAHIYNNVFYVKEGIPFIRNNMSGGAMKVENNIIYNSGSSPVAGDWYHQTSRATYSHNLYYNYSDAPIEDQNAVRVAAGTQVFEDPGKAPTTTSGTVNKHEDPLSSTVFDGYRLSENSPAINAGKYIENPGKKDFFGAATGGTPDLGANESDEADLNVYSPDYQVNHDDTTISGLEKGTTVGQLLASLSYHRSLNVKVYDKNGGLLGKDDLISGGSRLVFSNGSGDRTYTIAANTDNTIHSSVYIIKNTEIYMPMLENNPSTVKSIKSGIEVHSTADIKIYDGDQEVEKGNVSDGMTLKVIAENGAEAVYTLKEKNQYHWTLDYEHRKQGNVWFAQTKAGGVYSNLTQYDSRYSTWNGSDFACVGLDSEIVDAITESVPGLLNDTMGEVARKEGYSMAYRAPADGKITLSFRDMGAKKNANLRQASGSVPNDGGTTYLAFTRNGEELRDRIELPKNGDGVEINSMTLDVARGDYIRVEAHNTGTPAKPSIHVTPIITYENEEPKDITAPTVPEEIKVGKITANSAVLSWKASEDNRELEGYRIYDGSKLIATVKSTSVTLKNLKASTTYNIRVTAFDKAGNESEAATFTFTTSKKDSSGDNGNSDNDNKPDDGKPDNKPDNKPTPDGGGDNSGGSHIKPGSGNGGSGDGQIQVIEEKKKDKTSKKQTSGTGTGDQAQTETMVILLGLSAAILLAARKGMKKA